MVVYCVWCSLMWSGMCDDGEEEGEEEEVVVEEAVDVEEAVGDTGVVE